MIKKVNLDELKAFATEGTLLVDEPLRNHTTFKVGGKADAFLSVYSVEQLKNVIDYLKKEEIPYYVMGNGSNLLVSDDGFRGVILCMSRDFSDIQIEGNRIHVEAGALLSSVANTAMKNSLTGMEFAAGIPGSMGGAVVMNAGAYDGEMKDIVEKVTVLKEDGTIKEYNCKEMEFSYRFSRLSKEKDVVLSVSILLQNGNETDIKLKMKDFSNRRRDKQPLEYPSAGSTFKRPEGYFAGKLIMDAGMAGFSVGDAQVSEKHCGFVINKGNATAEEISIVIKEVQKRVFNQFAVKLEPEVIFLGEWDWF